MDKRHENKSTMTFYNNDLDVISGEAHTLLERPTPAYSNLTVRRAFIVWMYCGQKNKFRDVCGYYHRLEALEETLPPEQRAASRRHELDLFTTSPPTSSFLRLNFPELYCDHPIEPHITKLSTLDSTSKNEKSIFTLENLDYKQSGVTPTEILEASKIIRQYCQTHFIPLKKFLEGFQQYAARNGIKESVANVAAYIKKKQVEAEFESAENFPKSFNFLSGSSDSNENDILADDQLTESQKLKKLLGVSSKSNGEDSSETSKDSRSSCADFFKLFRNNLDGKCVSYSSIPPSFEDFALALDKNRSKSVENVNKTVLANKSSKRNQDIYDAQMKIRELAKVREI